MIKHIILIVSLALFSTGSFASKVGENNKQHNIFKRFPKTLISGFARKLYYDFEKQIQSYNQKAVAFNKIKKTDFKQLTKTSGHFMKKLKLKKMPIFKRVKAGYSYTSGKNILFVSMQLHIQNAIELNGQKVFLFGKNDEEIIQTLYNSIKETKLKKTSLINLLLPSAHADSSHKIEDYNNLGKKDIAMFYAMIAYWDWDIKDDPEFYKNEVNCKRKTIEKNKEKPQVSTCLVVRFQKFVSELNKSCKMKLAHERNFTKMMSSSKNLIDYRPNPDKSSPRKFITVLEHMYQDKGLRFVDELGLSENVAIFYNEHYYDDKLSYNKKVRAKYNVEIAKGLFKSYFPTMATEKGINTCKINMDKATNFDTHNGIISKENLSVKRKRQVRRLKPYNKSICSQITSLGYCISSIYSTQKEVVEIFDRAREKDKDIQRKYLDDDSRVYDNYHFYHPLQDKFYEK